VEPTIGPLHDPVTWCGDGCAGTRVAQWDFQNKGSCTSPGWLSFVLKVPLGDLRSGMVDSVPCYRIVQRAYWQPSWPSRNSPVMSLVVLLSWSGENYPIDTCACHDLPWPAMTSISLCATSVIIITFDQNWYQLYSSSAGEKDLSNNTQVRMIGSIEPEICTKMLRNSLSRVSCWK